MEHISGKIKKGIRIFLFITILTILLIIIFTVKKRTIIHFNKIDLPFFLLALAFCLIRIYLECLRLQTLCWGFGSWLNFKSSAQFTIGGYFLSLTPFGLGGVPLQFYILMREKFSFGESGAIIVMRGITWLISFMFIMPMIGKYAKLFTMKGVQILSNYLVISYSIGIILLIIAVFKTNFVKNLMKKIRGKKLDTIINKIINEIDRFSASFKLSFKKGKYKIILTIILSFISLISCSIISPLIFLGLGIEVQFMKTAIIQLILTFVLMFAPTPGGAGIAELVGFVLFREVYNKEMLGIYIIFWRFFTYYLNIIFGGIILSHLVIKGNGKNQ